MKHEAVYREKGYTNGLNCQGAVLHKGVIRGIMVPPILNFGSLFGQLAKIAADNKWLPAQISYRSWRLSAKNSSTSNPIKYKQGQGNQC